MEMTQFATTEAATRLGIVPILIGIISSGMRMRFIQKMPSGGIQAVLRIRSTVTVDCETYSTQALQNTVRARLTQGATTQPSRAKRICDRDGI